MHRVFWTAFGIAYLGLVPQLPAAAPALDGNCVVCLYDSGKLVPGKKDYQATIDRTTYYFPARNSSPRSGPTPRSTSRLSAATASSAR